MLGTINSGNIYLLWASARDKVSLLDGMGDANSRDIHYSVAGAVHR